MYALASLQEVNSKLHLGPQLYQDPQGHLATVYSCWEGGSRRIFVAITADGPGMYYQICADSYNRAYLGVLLPETLNNYKPRYAPISAQGMLDVIIQHTATSMEIAGTESPIEGWIWPWVSARLLRLDDHEVAGALMELAEKFGEEIHVSHRYSLANGASAEALARAAAKVIEVAARRRLQ